MSTLGITGASAAGTGPTTIYVALYTTIPDDSTAGGRTKEVEATIVVTN